MEKAWEKLDNGYKLINSKNYAKITILENGNYQLMIDGVLGIVSKRCPLNSLLDYVLESIGTVKPVPMFDYLTKKWNTY